MPGELRALYATIGLKDKITGTLTRVNSQITQTKNRITQTLTPVEALRAKFSRATDVINRHRTTFLMLGAAMTAIGYGGMKYLLGSARELDLVFKRLEATTAATGAELNTMKDTVLNLAQANSDAFGAIGEVVEITRKRFGDLGDQTTETNQAFLDFAKITRTNAVEGAEALTKIMLAYNIPAERAYEVTDLLIKTNQEFGVNLGKSASALGDQSVALQLWGLSLEESIGLLAAMDANGVKTSRALLGLKTASDEFKTPEEFWAYLEELSKIENAAERASVAEVKFGESGAYISMILDDGIEGLQKYIPTIEEATGATKQASKIYDESLDESWKIMINQLKLLAAALGSTLVPAMQFVTETINYLSAGFGKLPSPVRKVLSILTGATTLIALLGGGALLAATGIAFLSAQIATFGGLSAILAGASGAVTGFAASIWGLTAALAPYLLIAAAVIGVILVLQDLFKKGWKDSYLGKFFAWLLDKLPFLKPIVEQVSKAFKYLRWVLFPLLGSLASIFVIAKNWQKIKGIVTGVGASIREKLGGALDTVKEKAKKHQNILMMLFPLGQLGLLVKHRDRIINFLSSLPALFRDAGSKLILALVEGMKAQALAPVTAIKDIGAQIRSYLPFSDARQGPLADLTLSGQRLVETFSRGMLAAAPSINMPAVLAPIAAPIAGGSTSTTNNITHGAPTINLTLNINGAKSPRETGREVKAVIEREFQRWGIKGGEY